MPPDGLYGLNPAAESGLRPSLLVAAVGRSLDAELRSHLQRRFTVSEAAPLQLKVALLSNRIRTPEAVLLLLSDDSGAYVQGLDLLWRVRRASQALVMVLAGALRPDQKVRLLERGARDCLVQPTAPEEVVARLRAHLRRTSAEVLQDGDLTIDERGRRALYLRRTLPLTRMEFDLLLLLFKQRGQTVSREFLRAELKLPPPAEKSNPVEVHLSRLRSKLDACGGYGLIEAVRGTGYVLLSQ